MIKEFLKRKQRTNTFMVVVTAILLVTFAATPILLGTLHMPIKATAAPAQAPVISAQSQDMKEDPSQDTEANIQSPDAEEESTNPAKKDTADKSQTHDASTPTSDAKKEGADASELDKEDLSQTTDESVQALGMKEENIDSSMQDTKDLSQIGDESISSSGTEKESARLSSKGALKATALKATAKLFALDVITGDGYTFDENAGLLTITTNDATKKWRNDVKPEQVKRVVVQSGVSAIRSQSFSGCTDLTSVSLPSTLASIESAAFVQCSSLTSIHIPDGVSSIANDVFNSCSSLSSVNIPSRLSYIPAYMFSSCTNLTSISIPAGITGVGTGAFDGCSKLSEIYFAGSTAPVLSSSNDYVFGGVPFFGTIYYPAGSTGYTLEYFNQHTDQNRFDAWALDNNSPTLTPGEVSRTSNADATIKFSSNRAGTYYYAVVPHGDPKPTIDTNGVGAACTTAEHTIVLNTLNVGAKDIYITVKDASANFSDDSFHIAIPAYVSSYNIYPVVSHFGTWQGSGTASAKVDADHTKFIRLQYEGAIVNPRNYSISNGSTVITLTETYLKTFTNGNYRFVAEYQDGKSEDIRLTVSKANENSTVSETSNNGVVPDTNKDTPVARTDNDSDTPKTKKGNNPSETEKGDNTSEKKGGSATPSNSVIRSSSTPDTGDNFDLASLLGIMSATLFVLAFLLWHYGISRNHAKLEGNAD